MSSPRRPGPAAPARADAASGDDVGQQPVIDLGDFVFQLKLALKASHAQRLQDLQAMIDEYRGIIDAILAE